MSVQQISNLNIEMANVLPAQAITPTEKPAERPSEELEAELGSDLPRDGSSDGSRTPCTCVDTYA